MAEPKDDNKKKKKNKPKRYPCRLCGKTFPTARKLADHILYVHGNDPLGW